MNTVPKHALIFNFLEIWLLANSCAHTVHACTCVHVPDRRMGSYWNCTLSISSGCAHRQRCVSAGSVEKKADTVTDTQTHTHTHTHTHTCTCTCRRWTTNPLAVELGEAERAEELVAGDVPLDSQHLLVDLVNLLRGHLRRWRVLRGERNKTRKEKKEASAPALLGGFAQLHVQYI